MANTRHLPLSFRDDPISGDSFEEQGLFIAEYIEEQPAFGWASYTRLPEDYLQMVTNLSPLKGETAYRNWSEIINKPLIECDDYSTTSDLNKASAYAWAECQNTGMMGFDHPLYKLRREAIVDRGARENRMMHINRQWVEQSKDQNFLRMTSSFDPAFGKSTKQGYNL